MLKAIDNEGKNLLNYGRIVLVAVHILKQKQLKANTH